MVTEMYEELITQLRKMHPEEYVNSMDFAFGTQQAMHEAADAIEELSRAQEQWISQEREALLKSIPRWTKFEARKPDEEEKKEYPDADYIVVGNTPDDDQEILASDGKYVWKDTFCNDEQGCYLDNSGDLLGLWWMPLPELPKEDDT